MGWEQHWKFGKYHLGWYKKKILVYIPGHMIIGALFTLPLFYLFNSGQSYFGLSCFLLSLIAGIVIEGKQLMVEKQSWSNRNIWLFGSIRDIWSYTWISWVVFI